MLKVMGLILICVSALPTFCQPTRDYEPGTILAVAPHQDASGTDPAVVSYDVSVKVGDTVYVILYTPALGSDTARYVAGRELLVHVGENTVAFNDDLGAGKEAPILSRTTVAPQKTSAPAAPQPQAPVKSVKLVGLAGVKDNTEGTLSVEGGKLQFAHSKRTSDIAASAMEDVVTGNDSQRVIRGTVGKISMLGPYGSGRFLSLFRSKLDSLTIQYRDAEGGVHGVVFGVPVGQAESIKNQLIAEGAHTSIPIPAEPNPDSSKSVAMEGKQ